MTDGYVQMGLVGAGLIGRQHIEAMKACPDIELAAIIDPSDASVDLAASLNAPHHTSLDEALAHSPPDGIILATPNQHHAKGALACISAGIPVLIEKPLVSDLKDGLRIVEAADAAGVPVLTGHHRRHSPLISKAKEQIASGKLGRLVAMHSMGWLMKPDDYFEMDWRRQPGAGPVYINLVHDVDLMRHFCGEVASVHAFESNDVRENAVEDTAAIIMRFQSGALGTISLSDTIPAPWSWELTARENPVYPQTDQSCYWIGGTHGSINLPNAAFWSCPGERSWWEPIESVSLEGHEANPLVRQIENFAEVIRGNARPVVSARDGLKALAIIEAIKRSAATGETVTPEF